MIFSLDINKIYKKQIFSALDIVESQNEEWLSDGQFLDVLTLK